MEMVLTYQLLPNNGRLCCETKTNIKREVSMDHTIGSVFSGFLEEQIQMIDRRRGCEPKNFELLA